VVRWVEGVGLDRIRAGSPRGRTGAVVDLVVDDHVEVFLWEESVSRCRYMVYER
jgi:hypothetical protein